MAGGETTVLVSVDNSDISEKAYRWYLNTFHRPNHKLFLCHVPEYWGDVGHMMSPGRIKEVIEETNANTKVIEKKFSDISEQFGVSAEFEALRGQEVWNEICNQAKKINANVIVIGTRGMGKIKRTLLGSVSEGVLHHCHVPVLIYKE
ncbi:universal stress protein PHOS32-like [Haliotis rubra]|uniref:universal stress protein PHOS32-like n=1 Tax=Haliotis rubra TaxID=36100 RepID=UPI001EE53DA8|nr:universal stress protein PHOS32-like [Haliotis rubra]